MYLINLLYVNNTNIPAWVMCLIAVCISVSFCLIGLFVFKKLLTHSFNKANNDCISLSLGTVGLFSSVLISLIVINTWNSYNDTDTIVNAEARKVEDFYHLSQGMPEPIKSQLASDISEYIEVVTKEEWPAMVANEAIPDKARLIIIRSRERLLHYKTNDLVIANTESKLLDRISELFDARRDRTLSTKNHVPPVIWAVMFLSGFLTIAVSYLYTAESFAMHLISTGFISASLAATLFLIVIFGHPFQGRLRIEPTEMINFASQNLPHAIDFTTQGATNKLHK